MNAIEQLKALAEEYDIHEKRFAKGSIRRSLYQTFATRIRFILDQLPFELADIDDLRHKLEEAEREKNLAIVEAIGHQHAEGHLGDLVDELRIERDSACSDIVDLKREVREESAARELAEVEVASLRGKLEYTERALSFEKMNGDVMGTIREELHKRYDEECTFFDDAVHHVLATLETKLASLSLSNATLRTALVKCWNYIATGPHNPGQLEEAVVAGRDALAALPTDGLAEELVKYMEHKCGCEMAEEPGNNKPCTCGLDALLARIGGTK